MYSSVQFISVYFRSVSFSFVRFGSVRVRSAQFALVQFISVRFSILLTSVQFGSAHLIPIWAFEFDCSPVRPFQIKMISYSILLIVLKYNDSPPGHVYLCEYKEL